MVKDGIFRTTGKGSFDAGPAADAAGHVTGNYTGIILAKPATNGGILRPSTKLYIVQRDV